jgi:hypothetical protein
MAHESLLGCGVQFLSHLAVLGPPQAGFRLGSGWGNFPTLRKTTQLC